MPRVRPIVLGMVVGAALAIVTTLLWDAIPFGGREVLNLVAWPERILIVPLAHRFGDSAILAIIAVHVLYGMLLGGIVGCIPYVWLCISRTRSRRK